MTNKTIMEDWQAGKTLVLDHCDNFFTLHEINFDESNYKNIKFDKRLFKQLYNEFLDEPKNLEETTKQIKELFLADLNCFDTYYEPLIFDEVTALKCSLKPFKYQGKNMLALGSWGVDLYPLLQAYQFLTSFTIDSKVEGAFFSGGPLFRPGGHVGAISYYHEKVIGKDLALEIFYKARRRFNESSKEGYPSLAYSLWLQNGKITSDLKQI